MEQIKRNIANERSFLSLSSLPALTRDLSMVL